MMMSESFKWWFFFIKYVFKFDIYIMISTKYLHTHNISFSTQKRELEVILSTKEKHVQKETENMLVIRAYNP
jgi:hypothetical protein